jgi:hypothetical protein
MTVSDWSFFAQRHGLPGVLVDLVEAYHFAGSLGADRHDVAREVTNQVAAGNPGRQREALPAGQPDRVARAEL